MAEYAGGIDPSILLQAKGINLPNPIELAGQGISLANLAGRNQLQQYQLQTQQQYSQAVQQLGQAMQSGQDPDATMSDIAQQYPLAYAKILADQKALELTKAQIGAETGKGKQATAAATKDNLTSLGNLAGSLLTQVNNGQIDPWRAVGAVSFAAQKMGLDPQTFGLSGVPGGDPTQATAQLQSVAGGAIDAAKRIELGMAKEKLPYEIGELKAKAADVYAPKVAIDPFGRAVVEQRFDAQGNPNPAIYSAPTTAAPAGTPSTAPAPYNQNWQGTPQQIVRFQQLAAQDAAASGGATPPAAAPATLGGGTLPAPGSAQAQAIASYQAAPPNRATPFGAMLYDQVQKLNPNYDQTKWDAKVKTVDTFANGPEGQLLRSQNVAISHMAVLDQLGQALQNGNIQLFNQLAQQIAAQSGSAVPTNYNAAAQIVGKEVAKAVIPGAGGEGERDAIFKTFANAQSPQQIGGAINTYQQLLGGQMNGLRTQYNAGVDPLNTGQTDFNKFVSPETAAVLAKVQAQPGAPAGPMTPEKRDALVKGALDAISKGASKDAVRARLQQLGVTDARI